jgi:23S rRNA (cytosine1962-C5)-methyltransferase
MVSVVIRSGREKSIFRRHPWIYSGSILRMDGEPKILGETVKVISHEGSFLAWGAISPFSQIRVRLWSFDEDEEISPSFFLKRIERAIKARRSIMDRHDITALRLINGESDGLPGLIVDLYGKFLVCQFLSAGAEFWKTTIVEKLNEVLQVDGIYERSDTDEREKEGFPKQKGLLKGIDPPDLIEIREGDCLFLVDIKKGQKTGFYIDQRENRALLSEYSSGAEVLNCFSYTGAFCVFAMKGGASKVVNVESSAQFIKIACMNLDLNGIDRSRVENVEGNVFHVMRDFWKSGRSFDIVVLDPPKFVESRSHLKKAARGYKDINLLAFRLLRPGGLLFTFSCSGLMPPELFSKIVADAAIDAGREGLIIKRLHQGIDHPVSLYFPEGAYLKGLVCRVD